MTESRLLNPNRNPNMNRQQIEDHLRNYLGSLKRSVQLNEGTDLSAGETDGHIDDITVPFLARWSAATTTTTNEYYSGCSKPASKSLSRQPMLATQAQGSCLPQRSPSASRKREAENVLVSQGGKQSRWKMAAKKGTTLFRYANFLITNGSIIFPVYGLTLTMRRSSASPR